MVRRILTHSVAQSNIIMNIFPTSLLIDLDMENIFLYCDVFCFPAQQALSERGGVGVYSKIKEFASK